MYLLLVVAPDRLIIDPRRDGMAGQTARLRPLVRQLLRYAKATGCLAKVVVLFWIWGGGVFHHTVIIVMPLDFVNPTRYNK